MLNSLLARLMVRHETQVTLSFLAVGVSGGITLPLPDFSSIANQFFLFIVFEHYDNTDVDQQGELPSSSIL